MYDILEQELTKIHIKINDCMKQQFYDFYIMLEKWNKVMNLTGITEYEEVVQKHFVDSLAIVKVIDLEKIETVIDIGTGAGFPGIPIKIAYPHLKVTLLDSLNKRVRFLEEASEKIGLNGLTAIHGRAEDYARREEYREAYDICVSRAVANLSTLSEYCIPYVRIGGVFVSYKSEDIQEEISKAQYAVKALGGEIKETEKFKLPDTDIGRSLIVIQKKTHTHKKYPRKAGIPSKEPL